MKKFKNLGEYKLGTMVQFYYKGFGNLNGPYVIGQNRLIDIHGNDIDMGVFLESYCKIFTYDVPNPRQYEAFCKNINDAYVTILKQLGE